MADEKAEMIGELRIAIRKLKARISSSEERMQKYVLGFLRQQEQARLELARRQLADCERLLARLGNDAPPPEPPDLML